jgi:hypothetical protein
LAHDRAFVGNGPDSVTRIQGVPCTMAHVDQLSDTLRPLDREEMAAQGKGPRAILRASVMGSLWCRTYLYDGEVAAMMGLGGVAMDDLGRPWLLTSPVIEAIAVWPVIFEARKAVALMLAMKRRLENYVLAKYEAACRFLRLLGFHLDPPAPFGPKGVPFRRFHLDADQVSRRAWQVPTRRAGAQFRPFIVFTAGRSRTAWLSSFLDYGQVHCHCEAAMRFRNLGDVREFFDNRTGSAETAASPGWHLIRHVLPQARFVVVRRPVEDIIASSAWTLGKLGPFDQRRLRHVVEYENRCLDKIAALPGTLVVDFDDLEEEETCRRLFEFCLPYEFDGVWWVAMRDRHIEMDMPEMIRYYQAHYPQIEQFRRSCKTELVRLARAGAIA